METPPFQLNLGHAPDQLEMVFSGSPGATLTKGTPRPTSIYRLQIDRLPPGHNIRLGIRTSLQPWKDRDFSFDTPLWRGLNEPPSVAFYFDGNYQFEYQGIRIPREFFAPIGYDKDSREMRLIEVLDNYGTWKRVEHVGFCLAVL